MYNQILFKVENNIATITLNRPEFGNAFHQESYGEVKNAIKHCGEDDSIRAVIITGAGKHFSAGGDINRFKNLIETEAYLPRTGVLNAGAMTRSIRECPKPVIAMINGAAAGAGCALALSCDFRVMSEKSKLATSFIGLGFSGDTGLIYFLKSMIGMARTTELLMLPKPILAQQAYDLGICNRLAEEGKLEEVTMELATQLAAQPTQAIARQKKLFNQFFFKDLEEFNTTEAEYMFECGRTQDHAEAVHAFLEKRKPKFSGK
ncbi:MAG: enoyl-CoA hydratase/isomerase family protein [Clostridiaceae bacterium]